MKIWAIIIVALLSLSSCKQGQEGSLGTVELETTKTFPPINPFRYNVGFLIMDGTYNTEFTAPFDIFQHTIYRDSIKAMNVFTVANTDDPITTFEGVRIIPDYNYLNDEIPKIDILVIPSAEHHLDTDLEDTAMLEWVKQVADKAMFVTSHCDGAFVLAKAGLLDGLASTTFPSDVDKYKEMFPELDVREDVLFVRHNRFITSAGGAKSFEAALFTAELLYGKEVAKRLAQGLVIDWDLDEVPHVNIVD
ncbi:DJ-1/PfpI family protein [Gilvibacter sediminis]|uniref:DJ-1/PfpI family protein n=1 Tax=Gilvibacter sediminis TaxID=379071 RepID=UPI0023503065|nr:DJ-1/PfpI family protein [Gilvibacter sediminis]MDC7999334.1 DJ-1/PfpI family protein [Gilvibacter sediminis]